MNLISVEDISKSIGDLNLFDSLSFGLEQGQKVALIARNGTGKTTLLNIIAGLDTPDTGQITFRQGLRVAYLQQNPVFNADLTLTEALFDASDPLSRITAEYKAAIHAIKADTEKIASLTEDMERLDAWDYDARVKEVLGKLGFANFAAKVGTLSGGQKKKLALARVLLSRAEVLILDEPTNHLDIPMTEWLEAYLNRQKLSLLLVSHDRYFIDNVCNEIYEIENHKLYRYKGNYIWYLEKKAEREENEMVTTERLHNRYRTELDWMRRSPQARTTKQKARVSAFYNLEEKASRRPEKGPAAFSASPQRIGNKILELNYICKSFGSQELIRDLTYTFKRGEKIGLVGPNGSGKSTLLNLIMGHIRPDKGSIVKGETILFGYFRQDGLMPETDKRVIEIVKEVAEEVKTADGSLGASQFLNYFGFSYPAQHNFYSRLSGGERRKLYLLVTLMQNPNFLILDEPTNDLDIYTLSRLEEFLDHYSGCVLVVSHDRFFIDRVAQHIFVFEGDGRISDFPGTYSQYIEHSEKTKIQPSQSKPPARTIESPKVQKGLSYKQKKELEMLEEEIRQLEYLNKTLLDDMNAAGSDHHQLEETSRRYRENASRIEEKTQRWMELAALDDMP